MTEKIEMNIKGVPLLQRAGHDMYSYFSYEYREVGSGELPHRSVRDLHYGGGHFHGLFATELSLRIAGNDTGDTTPPWAVFQIDRVEGDTAFGEWLRLP